MTQFFTPLTEPVGALWSLMVLGVLWLLCRRQWHSAFWLGMPTVVLFVIGSTPLPERLVASEERQWAENSDVRGQLTEAGKAENRKQPGEVSLLERGQDSTGQADFTGQGKSESGNRKSESGITSERTSSGLRPPSPRSGEGQVSALSLQPSAFPYDVVVALGGGERISRFDLLGFAEGDGGSRVLTAIQLVRSGRAKTLVLGGSWPLPGRPEVPRMSVVQVWVTNWGLVGGVVTNLGICINTHEEAVAFKKLARSRGWSKVLLVSSALHLRRAVALFKKQGIEVTPVAADFQALGVPPDPFSLFPREHRFFLLALYLHEKIGWWVYRARGWVG